MWIGVLWAGVRAAMWSTHVGGKFRHGLLEKSQFFRNSRAESDASTLLGCTPKGAHSTRGRSRHLLETPLLRTPSENPSQNPFLISPPSQNPSQNPFPRTPSPEPFPERSQNPS